MYPELRGAISEKRVWLLSAALFSLGAASSAQELRCRVNKSIVSSVYFFHVRQKADQMRMRGFASVVTLGAALLSAGTAQAQAITPIGMMTDQSGNAALTFGGTGIPKSAVMSNLGVREINPGSMMMTAHQRFGAPALTNNGNGIFFAVPGISQVSPSPADPYALWNIGFFINPVGNRSPLTFKWFYDFDPASGNAQSAHGVVDFGLQTTLFQGSWNMGMNFLDAGAGQPAFPAFDPNAEGQYTFALVAFDGQTEVDRTAIQVNVGESLNVVPEPSTYALMATGLIGVVGIARRRNSKNIA